MNKLISGIILLLGMIYFIGGYLSVASKSAKNGSEPLQASSAAGNKEAQFEKFKSAINNNLYYSREGGEKFSIQFKSENQGENGIAIFTLPNNCQFVYDYILERDHINLTYLRGTCKAQGSNVQLIMKSNGHIIAKIRKQEFVFVPHTSFSR